MYIEIYLLTYCAMAFPYLTDIQTWLWHLFDNALLQGNVELKCFADFGGPKLVFMNLSSVKRPLVKQCVG